MPPAVFAGAVAGVAVTGLDDQVFAPLSSQKVGDTQIALIASDTTGATIDTANALDWTQLTEIVLGNAKLFVARREVKSTDPATIPLKIDLNTAITWALPVLLTYRSLNNAADLLEGSGTNIAASTNFVCPSRALVNYSDLYLGIVVVTSAAVAITNGSGTERYEVGSGGRQLEVFDFLQEAPGATGTKTSTTAANQSGIAVSLALAGQVAPGFGKTLSLSPIGTFGLPKVGV